MDIYKSKFTQLQEQVLRFLFVNVGKNFNQRSIAKNLDVSPTAISNSLSFLEKEDLIFVKKDKESQTLEIGLNLDNPEVFYLKRVENLRMLYLSQLPLKLMQDFPGTTIVLFGSYSLGEDRYNSDIDIAIIGVKEKNLDLRGFEKIFFKKIVVQFYPNFREIHKNLKESILNGIVLKGSVEI